MAGAAGQDGGSERLAGPWARCWAKLIDLWLAAGVIFAGWVALTPSLETAPVVGGVVRRLGEAHYTSLLDVAAFALLIAATFVLDAFVQFVFGVTPGLALVGARLQREDHRRLSLAQALRRNLYVWLFGFWICIGWYPMLLNYLALVENRLPRWDRRFGTRVFCRGCDSARSLAAGVAYAAQLGLYLWLLDRFRL